MTNQSRILTPFTVRTLLIIIAAFGLYALYKTLANRTSVKVLSTLEVTFSENVASTVSVNGDSIYIGTQKGDFTWIINRNSELKVNFNHKFADSIQCIKSNDTSVLVLCDSGDVFVARRNTDSLSLFTKIITRKSVAISITESEFILILEDNTIHHVPCNQAGLHTSYIIDPLIAKCAELVAADNTQLCYYSRSRLVLIDFSGRLIKSINCTGMAESVSPLRKDNQIIGVYDDKNITFTDGTSIKLKKPANNITYVNGFFLHVRDYEYDITDVLMTIGYTNQLNSFIDISASNGNTVYLVMNPYSKKDVYLGASIKAIVISLAMDK